MQNRLIQGLTATDSSFAPNAASPAWPMTAGTMPCSGMVVPAAWMAIYRLAYQQARVALEPSPFQRRLRPSLN